MEPLIEIMLPVCCCLLPLVSKQCVARLDNRILLLSMTRLVLRFFFGSILCIFSIHDYLRLSLHFYLFYGNIDL